MAEVILGIICIIVGVAAIVFAFIVEVANGIGGATNPSMVSHTPSLISLVVAVLAFWGAVSLLF